MPVENRLSIDLPTTGTGTTRWLGPPGHLTFGNPSPVVAVVSSGAVSVEPLSLGARSRSPVASTDLVRANHDDVRH